jgi:hypothetical protein
MSHPGEPSDSSAKEPAVGATELSPEDFERLSASFRPSWQLDDAPFTGASSLSTSDIRALQGSDARAEVHALVQQAKNGSHAPAKASGVVEPSESVIVEPTPPVPASRPMPVPVAVAVPTPSQAAPIRRAAVAIPRTRPRLASLELDGVVPSFARRSRKPLWIGLAGAVAVAGGIGLWAVSGGTPASSTPVMNHVESSGAPAAPAAEPVAPAAEPTPAPPPAPVPAPPPATAAATQGLPPSPPITMRPATPPSPPAAPATPPITMRATTPPSPPPAKAPPPAPVQVKTAPRPKAAPTTIVRDVPF